MIRALLFMIAVVVLVFGLFWWSGANRAEAFGYCEMRRMEQSIPMQNANIYIDHCMASRGFNRPPGGCSYDLPAYPFCYEPAWVFWR